MPVRMEEMNAKDEEWRKGEREGAKKKTDDALLLTAGNSLSLKHYQSCKKKNADVVVVDWQSHNWVTEFKTKLDLSQILYQ